MLRICLRILVIMLVAHSILPPFESMSLSEREEIILSVLLETIQ